MKKKINLFTEIDDDFEGNWWVYTRSSSDFAYYSKIPDREALEVDDDDILIHKQMETNEDSGARFVSKNYFQVLDGTAYQIDVKEFRKLISKCVIRYINTHGKYPIGWSLNKVQKKDSIAILHYKMSDFDSWNLKILPGKFKQFSGLGAIVREDVVDYFSNLKATTTNPLTTASSSPPSSSSSTRLPKITSAPEIQATAAETGGKVFITNAKIEQIDQRKSTYLESETIYYVLHLRGGSVADSKKKTAIPRDFVEIHARCSENAKNKFDLELGDVVSFNGQFRDDRSLGLIVQNIRKFVKEPQT